MNSVGTQTTILVDLTEKTRPQSKVSKRNSSPKCCRSGSAGCKETGQQVQISVTESPSRREISKNVVEDQNQTHQKQTNDDLPSIEIEQMQIALISRNSEVLFKLNQSTACNSIEFYINLPEGTCKLPDLLEHVVQRLEILSKLINKENVEMEEIEQLRCNTTMDEAAHHILKSVCPVSEDLKTFFVRGETEFFSKCIMAVTDHNILNLMEKLKKDIDSGLRFYSECEEMVEVLSVIRDTWNQMEKNSLLHAFRHDHREDCEKFNVKLRWQWVELLVEHRLTRLFHGWAHVGCGVWRRYLLPVLFSQQLNTSLEFWKKRAPNARDELGMRGLGVAAHGLDMLFQKYQCGEMMVPKILYAADVDENIHLFPPCQANLMRTLRHCHRLSHEARRILSLFLKDAGMPLEEAITFWSNEYSLTPVGGCCSHSWPADARRLIYSIRHMYGMEGGCINYYSHTCNQIQEMQRSALGEGGCPFVHFDRERLMENLSPTVRTQPDVVARIMSLASESPCRACTTYLCALLGSSQHQTDIHSPINYYCRATANLSW